MGIDALHCAKTFYVLESLKLIVEMKMEFGKKSHERLLADIVEYRHKYVSGLKQAFYDYTALVCYGEMRHATDRSTHYNPNVQIGGKRNESYYMAKQYNPTSILIASEKLFRTNWCDAFGGEKWSTIANRVMLKDKIDDSVYCDMCFSLSHNSSPYLDKYQSDIFKIDDKVAYINLLNTKFEAKNPKEIVYKYAGDIGRELKCLVRRAVVLGFIHNTFNIEYQSHRINNNSERYIMNYCSVRWGKEWLDDTVIFHRDSLYNKPMSRLEDYADYEKTQLGDLLEIKFDGKLFGHEEIKKGTKARVINKSGYAESFEVVFVGNDNCDSYRRKLVLETKYFRKLVA